MGSMCKTGVFTLILLVLFTASPVFAAGIQPDGSFDDWREKPQLADSRGDEVPSKDMVLVKWFPDPQSERLYLYCERVGNNEDLDEDVNEDDSIDADMGNWGKKDDEVKKGQYKHIYWRFELHIESDSGRKTAVISYRPVNQRVLVTLYDDKGNYLWSINGKWGDDKDQGKAVEFYIPFAYLTSSIISGYQVGLYYISGTDRVPGSGLITISTISTFPVQAAVVLALFVAVNVFIFRRRKDKLQS